MDPNPQSTPPRKACDVCYRKRIKCDSQRPRCSNCILYETECTFKASSRKYLPKKQPPNGLAEDLQARVESLESSLKQTIQRVGELETITGAITVSPDSIPQADHATLDGSRYRNAPFELPSSHEVIAAVEKYLETLNSVLPLFNADRLLHLVNGWYTSSSHRDCTTWATINVILALAHRDTPPQDITHSRNAANYIGNAQAVLVDVVIGETTLLSVQCLVGMVLLFQGVQDLKPATMLIAVTMRLAHQLGLHRRDKAETLDGSLMLERTRIFWIAYILDRDISIRTNQPPIQRDIDIDLDWPLALPPDGAGVLVAGDGISSFNFFLARVQLAQIQGDLFDVMNVKRAEVLNEPQQIDKTAALHRRLDDWVSCVPRQFKPDVIWLSCKNHWRRSFGVLFASQLACRVHICRAHIMETQWLQLLEDFGNHAARDEVAAPVPLPQGWGRLVNEAREYMGLFAGVEPKDPAFVWMTACTYISAAVCLIANSMFSPQNENVEHDEYLIINSITFLSDMVSQVPYEGLKRTQVSCEGLFRHTQDIRHRTSAI